MATKALPEYRARQGDGPMDEADFRAVVGSVLSECVQYVDAELSIDRAKATDYYTGKPFGNEEEGRSQVVLTEVADAVDGMIPSLVRVIFGPEHVVEFLPSRAETVAMAEQATDYVRYVFEQDNAGFLQTHSVLKDGLIRRLGIFKWAWEPAGVKTAKLENLSVQELEAFLTQNPDVNVVSKQTNKKTKTVTVEITHGKGEGRCRIWALPPEEFIVSRNARELGHAVFYGHRTEKTRGELIAMGIDAKVIDEHASPDDADTMLRANAEELARRQISGFTADPRAGKANDRILYVDGILSIDFNGDGVAEDRRICTIGVDFYPVTNDPADESMGFSLFSPIPEPHALIGRSIYDKTADVQRISSAILRSALDSASASAFPRMAILEGQVSTADVLNTAISAPIRERVMNAVRPIEVPFVADKLMPLIAFMQEVVERRTGRNKGAAGLDMDALQSTGKEAVGAVLTGSQEQVELIARVFCEQTLKSMFAGIAKLLQLKRPQSRLVKLRGQWIDVNPAAWDSNMDVMVNVALGATFVDKKIAVLTAIAQDQKEWITTMGPTNPVCTLPMLRNTKAKIANLAGIKDVDSYYQPMDPHWQPPAPPPPQPSPEVQWMMTEKEMAQQKAMKELAIEADKIAMAREKQERDFQLAVLKLEADVAMKKYAADAQFHAVSTDSQLQHSIQSATAEAEMTMSAQGQAHEQMLAENDQQHSQAMDTRAADTAEAQPEPAGDA